MGPDSPRFNASALGLPLPFRKATSAMRRFSFRLAKRADEAVRPLNNLWLALAFACVGLFNTALNLMTGHEIGLWLTLF